MAAKKDLVAETTAPSSDPVDHPDPVGRKHLWERPARPDEVAPTSLATDYPYALPRWLHKDGAQQRVDTAQDCADALADGWLLHPAS